MKKNRRPSFVIVLCLMLCIFACVTINIYFPAEKVESVAGEIVDEIRSNGPEEEKKPAEKEKTSLLRRSLMALACSSAWAEEVTSVSNATIRGLKEKMKARYAQMKPYYQDGMIQEGDNGYVSEGKVEGLGLKERRDLKNLVDAENKDRERLYEEIAKALEIDSSQINRIAEIFAKEWQKH